MNHFCHFVTISKTVGCTNILEGFSKDDMTPRQRENGVKMVSYFHIWTWSRHFHVVFGVVSSLLKPSIVVQVGTRYSLTATNTEALGTRLRTARGLKVSEIIIITRSKTMIT